MTTHMSARTQRMEVITRGERRRRWSIEEKREIVAESLQPGIGPSEIIRKHGISSGQLYTWRQQLARRLGGEPAGSSANFARVDVVVAQRQEKAVLVADVPPAAVTTDTASAGDCCAASRGVDRDRVARRHLGARRRTGRRPCIAPCAWRAA